MKKIIAWYLPQFHTFKENNENWGEGFTEWTLVNQAKPKFENHHIFKPHQDIGYYSLEDINTRKLQADLAKQYGVFGFCYYHYWFGKPVMEKPLMLMLKDGEPDLPFCFSWANEPWKKNMNGGDHSIILEQNYGGEKEWTEHLNFLMPFFKHKNYIKINNKPMFVIYRISQIKEYQKRLDFYRNYCVKNGFNDLYIVSTLGNFYKEEDHLELSKHIDAGVEFYPNFLGDINMMCKQEEDANYYKIEDVQNHILNFPTFYKTQFKSTLVGFDTNPRRNKKCNIIIGNSPNHFRNSLIKQCQSTKEEFVFVNAWNEWSESAALEPEQKFGYQFLKMVKNVNSKIY